MRPKQSSQRCRVLVAVLVGVVGGVGHAQQADERARVLSELDARASAYADVAMKIWGFAERGFQETQSSALLQQQLSGAAFEVTAGVAEMPTSFVASYGAGHPVIGIVGEFDALPGLSQEAVPERKPRQDGAPGHGCGHHLFGTASTAAAVAVKTWLAATGRPGTVRFYGTPAEEGGSGEVYMVRAGLFDDVDAVVSWHPGDHNEATPSSTLANITAKFRFHGIAAHAAAAPEKGRSALDGVEAMTHMVNMMREHVPERTRIHYVITRGGPAPNVVPDFAELYLYARLDDMTVEHEITGAVYNVLPNDYLSSLMTRSLERVGGVTYTDEERAFADQIRNTLAPPLLPPGSELQILNTRGSLASASTDMGDVSWRVPTVQLTAATWVPGTPAHSWQAVAAGGTSIGAKGMMVAAKTMALTAMELFLDPTHVKAARAEFDKRTAGFVYRTRLGDRKP